MILGMVHGTTVDGHFFDALCNYYQSQIHNETVRLGDALKEAAEHVDDPDLATKYREVAESRPFQYGTASIRSGPLLSMGRGRQCQTFLDHTDDEWMFVSDTDMVWDPTLPEQMLQRAQQGAVLDDGTVEPIRILAAPAWIIWTKQDGTVDKRLSNVYQGFEDDKGQPWLSQMTEESLKEPGLYKVGACGGALMLIHRDALVNIRDNVCGGQPFWWHHLATPPIAESGICDQYGEDTSFCIRARQAGENIWVHSGIRIGHSKTTVQY